VRDSRLHPFWKSRERNHLGRKRRIPPPAGSCASPGRPNCSLRFAVFREHLARVAETTIAAYCVPPSRFPPAPARRRLYSSRHFSVLIHTPIRAICVTLYHGTRWKARTSSARSKLSKHQAETAFRAQTPGTTYARRTDQGSSTLSYPHVTTFASATHPTTVNPSKPPCPLDKKSPICLVSRKSFLIIIKPAGGSGESHSRNAAGRIGTRGAPSGQKTRCQRGNSHPTNADPNASGSCGLTLYKRFPSSRVTRIARGAKQHAAGRQSQHAR